MGEGLDGWGRGLVAAAGLLGAAGVALAAASSHVGGGELARLAAFFLLLHAAAIPGILALPLGGAGRVWVSGALALGTVLFSGDVGVLALTGRTPIDGMAPAGGFLLLAGWLGLAVVAATSRGSLRPRR